MNKALDRGLELLDLTLSSDIRFTARYEVARAREVAVDYFLGGNYYQSTPASLENYFNQFALLARQSR